MANTVRFLALVFTALALVPTGAHLLELPNKLPMSHDAYFAAQQVYRGWAWLGIIVLGAIASTLTLAVVSRHDRWRFSLAASGCLAIVATQVVFWTFTFPANQATNNWTILPANWLMLRSQWEYSHAASGLFNIAALLVTALAVLPSKKQVLSTS